MGDYRPKDKYFAQGSSAERVTDADANQNPMQQWNYLRLCRLQRIKTLPHEAGEREMRCGLFVLRFAGPTPS
jgi:hypothetical protein